MWVSSLTACRHLLVMLLAGMVLIACTDSPSHKPRAPLPIEVRELAGSTMGTTWSVLWVDELPVTHSQEPDDILNAIEAELGRINALMSTWDPGSELSLFNASRSVEPATLHRDTLQVIDSALSLSRLTEGSYDITLQPVIELWGFGRNNAMPVPSDQDIESALESTGYQQLVRVGHTVRKRRPDIAIDVSSIAKGYAVDRVGEVVETFGISRYLVDIGGEIRTRGGQADDQPWRVGVESPEGEVPQVLAVFDAHIASSGSYRNYRSEQGKRLSHIIDGKTGRPVEHHLVSVNVIHDSAMLADAWATALLVVGESRASQLIEEQSLVAQLTVSRDGKFQQIPNAAFKALLRND